MSGKAESNDEHRVADLREHQRCQAAFDGDADLLPRVERRRENLDDHEPEQTDSVGDNRGLRRHDIGGGELAVMKQRGDERGGEQPQRERSRQCQQDGHAQSPV